MTKKIKLLSTFLANQGVNLHALLEPQVAKAWKEYQDWSTNGLLEGQSVLQTAKHFRGHQALALELESLSDICDLLRGFRDHYQAIIDFYAETGLPNIPTGPTLSSLYSHVIIEATGCNRAQVHAIEQEMRETHSTLDHLTRPAIIALAKKAAKAIQRRNRK